MNTWATVTRKGRARPARGGGGGGFGGLGQADPRAGGSGVGVGAVGGGGGGGNGGGAPRPRTKLKPSDTKANIYDRPNTVVMECQEFSILPPEEELVDFLHENVLPEDDKSLFTKVMSLFSDESARKYLVWMTDEESTTQLAEILAGGVSWPGYTNYNIYCKLLS